MSLKQYQMSKLYIYYGLRLGALDAVPLSGLRFKVEPFIKKILRKKLREVKNES